MRKILVVDDQEDVRELVTLALSAEPYAILEAADGEEALRIARAELPDLVLLDLRMPKIDGFEVMYSLKGDPATAGIPIAVMTAIGSPSELAKGRLIIADDFLLKPFSPLALRDRVRRLLLR